MEVLPPESRTIITDMALFILAHTAIFANTAWVRPAIHNATYDRASLYVEHYLSYLTTCFAGRALNQIIGGDFNDLLIPFFRAVGGDIMLPTVEEGRPQWDQFAADISGIGTYVSFIR